MAEISIEYRKCCECHGTGKAMFLGDPNARCMQCMGNGNVTVDRFNHLVNVYWPQRMRSGKISQEVFDEKIANLRKWWDTGTDPYSWQSPSANRAQEAA